MFRTSRKLLRKRRIVSLRKPTTKEILGIRTLIIFGVISMITFLSWFLEEDHIGYRPLFWLLTTALLFKFLRWLHEWYHYYSVSYPPKAWQSKEWTVDMFTTHCPGEPYDMVLNTLKAMQAIEYPHTTYLCDEGNDPYLKQQCEALGVVHVTRTNKINAKAGNINNALRQATGEICVILDPDHQPEPDFLERVLPYFSNPQVGFVQVVQAYGNQDESLIARAAAEQTYHFYGPIMMGMNSYGTTQAIGANCTFRREALDSIGGHAPGLAEDMHTAMQIHAKGWKSIYHPEILTRGQVPSTLSAYYKQQLKWARGCFELLFVTYPKLFKNFTWRQKLHYFLIPLHFLSGLVTLMDIAVPVLCLLLAQVAWKIDFQDFFQMFFPLFIFSMLIRQYAQRWLSEKREYGLHLLGGIMRMGTWWIYLLGFIYTILRIPIPYIPTPKDDKPENSWKLSIPNMIVIAICLFAVVYGLSLDWTPYSFFMAGFALINAALLSFVVLLSQQKLLNYVADKMNLVKKPVQTTVNHLGRLAGQAYHGLLAGVRKSSVVLAVLFFVFAFGYNYETQFTAHTDYNLEQFEPPMVKETGGFYTGIYMPNIERDGSLQSALALENKLGTSFDIVSIYQYWGPNSIENFPEDLLQNIIDKEAIPMITWEPWTERFPQYKDHPELGQNRKLFGFMLQGYFDDYIKQYALKLRALKSPVMLRFAHEMDNPAYPWSESGGNSPEEFKAAWKYLVTMFDSLGVDNVTWVWNPWEEDKIDQYYPGSQYVDWIGVTSLNYGLAASDGKWWNFEDLYKPFSDKIKKYMKPVLLAEFGSTTFGGSQAHWIDHAFDEMRTDFPEIQSVVFFYSDEDKNWGFTDWRPADGSGKIDWTFQSDQTAEVVKENLHLPYFSDNRMFACNDVLEETPSYTSSISKPYLKGGSGNFQLLVDGKPFYVKGVAYNPGHDWRDGDVPLTRSKLEDDFKLIKAMGANTIRRYDPGVYDINLTRVADEYDIKILYGFWFEQDVDYNRDAKKLKQYLQRVEKTVRDFRDEPSVLGWVIGNEVWGLLKHPYGQPYRYKVRQRYVDFIELVAEKIHELDPTRPVITVLEHSDQLPAALYAFEDAPSVDVIGINSYYEKHISSLDKTFTAYYSNKPYLVSEYGPNGYWHPDYNQYDQHWNMLEPSGQEKAALYKARWKDYVQPNKGDNVGAVAYCWSDRLEGTATWFGLTDNEGRRKPAYFALQQAWTGKTSNDAVSDIYVFAPEDPLEPGKTYTFFAVTKDNPENLEFEWFLCRDEFIQMKDADIELSDNGRVAKVTIPDKPSEYRLYVKAGNDDNAVNSASYPIPAFRESP